MKNAIEGWQEADKEKRALITIAMEVKEENLETNEVTSGLLIAVLGGRKKLVKALQGALKQEPLDSLIMEALLRNMKEEEE